MLFYFQNKQGQSIQFSEKITALRKLITESSES